MSKLLAVWPEICAATLAILVYGLSDLWYAAFFVAVCLIVMIRGHAHVADNTQRPLFVFGNYVRCVGPGHHFAFWPFAFWDDVIDTRYALTECQIVNASSSDRVPFHLVIRFAYRFLPCAIHDRQRAQEVISGGPSGWRIIAQEAAQNSALYIVRGYSHLQLLTGSQQALIQGQIAQEAVKRLSPAGIEIQTAGFRVTFEGPKELQAAFIQQQAARPAAQTTVINMVEILTHLKQYGTPEMQRYLDLLMVQAVRHQNVDPLSALVAQEWFNHMHNRASGNP